MEVDRVVCQGIGIDVVRCDLQASASRIDRDDVWQKSELGEPVVKVGVLLWG